MALVPKHEFEAQEALLTTLETQIAAPRVAFAYAGEARSQQTLANQTESMGPLAKRNKGTAHIAK
jgi:hypothetical protein